MLAQPPLWFIIIAFLCLLGPLVVFHELGHYWVARWFGVGAEQFSIGFGREIVGWTDKRGTRWKVGWLPLGGYVKFIGDMNPASQPGDPAELPKDVRQQSFHLRPWWQRFLIVLAGPLANYLLAIAIFAAFFLFVGVPSASTEISRIVPGKAASRSDLRAGDVIQSVAGTSVGSLSEIQLVVMIRPGHRVPVEYVRDGQRRRTEVTIGVEERVDDFGQKAKMGMLGIEAAAKPLPASQAIPKATRDTIAITRTTLAVLGQILTGERPVKDLGGPLKVAQVAGQQASLGLYQFIYLIGFLSINLGFINLLPVPVLDGGHLVFYAAEAIRRRPLSEQAQEWAFRGGFALIVAWMLLLTFNDLASFGLFERLGRLIG
ncbi:MAG: M50 family metallopeptidase [Sphingomicrobium sp.]